MIVERIVQSIPIGSQFSKLIIGSVITALLISLGMVYILKLFNFSINPAIPSAFAAIGAAIFAARFKNKK